MCCCLTGPEERRRGTWQGGHGGDLAGTWLGAGLNETLRSVINPEGIVLEAGKMLRGPREPLRLRDYYEG